MNNFEHLEADARIAKTNGIQRILVGAIVSKDGQVLLLQRSQSEDFPGMVEIPSGGVEEGESLMQALSRELMEETGLQIDGVIRFVDYFEYRSTSGKLARQYNFLVVSKGETITLNPNEHSAHFWAIPREATLANFNLSDETKQSILYSSQNR